MSGWWGGRPRMGLWDALAYGYVIFVVLLFAALAVAEIAGAARR